MKKPGILLALSATSALFLAVPAAAQDKIGETTYQEGNVSVDRNGSALDASTVEIGMEIDNFDFMQTGDDGTAQVKVTTQRAPAATIVVSPDTQFTFELNAVQGRQHGSLNLISGSVSLKVSKLTAAQDLDVQTESTTLGVRGTEFDVSSSISGDILVTCTSGEVVATDQSGTQFRAVPGTVVENRSGGVFRAIPVAGPEREQFRRRWLQDRAAEGRTNALGLIRASVGRYQQLKASMDRDYAQLERQKAILSKWTAEDRRGAVGSAAEIEKEKAMLEGTLSRLRQEQFVMERVHYRLVALKRLHDQGFGRGAISGTQSTEQFFSQFQNERKGAEARMSTVRYAAKLYARRNNGLDPTSRAAAGLRASP
ncbi:MAG TPA: FecR family protein, partial [Spirochaetia bacterium]|nr:FecR family protein [Spirochaetia bacterium]